MGRIQRAVRAVVESLEGRTLMAASPLAVSEVATTNGMQLKVLGTSGDDQITVSKTATGLSVSTRAGWSGTYDGTYRTLLIDAGPGDDTVAVDPNVDVDAILYGGDGDDAL